MTNHEQTEPGCSAKSLAEDSDFESSGHKTLVTDGGQDITSTRTVKNEGSGGDTLVTRTVTAKEVVTRELDDEEREVLRVPISSTRADREGDAFSEDDLKRRADQIRDQQPLVFDDHGGGMFGPGYSARETIGTQFDAELEEDDDGHHTLYAYINPDHSHEEGTRMLQQVRDEKQAIKFSVGFRIIETADDLREDDRPDRANEVAGRLFTRTDLMETSRVGIPANPDASAGVTAKNGGGHGLGFSGMEGVPVVLPGGQLGLSALTEGAAAQGGGGQAFTAKDTMTGNTNNDSDSDVDALREELDALRSEVEELREDDEDDEDDGDGGEDDEDEDDDEDEESSASLTIDGKELSTDEAAEVRQALADYRDATTEGRGTPESGETDTTSKDALPGDDSDGGESKSEEDSAETNSGKTAFELSRGN